MRNTKELTINEKKITVMELTVRDIKNLWADLTGQTPETETTPMFTNEQMIRKHWDRCIHGLKLEEADDLAPSELKNIYDAFSEVNAVFFDLALRIEQGENPFLRNLREAITNDLLMRFAALSQEDTQESGTTDMTSS